MAELVTFRAALGRVGFTPPMQDAIIAQGLTSMPDLLLFQKEQIKRICKVIHEREANPIEITIRQEQMLETMRYWVQRRVRANLPINPALFTVAVAYEKAMQMVAMLEESMEKEPDVKMPDKFKLTSMWIIFSEAFGTYLNRLKGTTSKISLNYIIRDTEIPNPGAVYLTENETLVQNASLVGPNFDKDNSRVYGILKQLILEGPAWSFITPQIDRAAHGRLAWLALRAHYEGESFMTKQKEEAYAALDAVHYKGEKATFTFEHFTNIMTKAYNDLQRFGEPVLERKKVRDLLSKITDPKLDAAKQTIRITAGYKDSFAAAVNFLAESVVPLAKGASRNIAELQTSRDGRGPSSRGGRHGGHARYTGGRHPSPGRGRGGRGRFQGRYAPRGRGRGARHIPYIQPQDWANLTHEEQQSVLTTRGTLRQVESLMTEAQDQLSTFSAVTGITNPPPPAPVITNISQVSAATQASVPGSAFSGRAAYRHP